MKKFFILLVWLSLISYVFALQTQWNTNGEQIFEMENINYSSIVADNNYYYVSYDAAFDGDRDIYMQKYDENFTPLWGEHGIKLCYAPHSQETSKIFLINDFLYVVWHDFRANNGKFSLYIQKLTKEGEILWASSGIQISDEFNSFCDYNVLSDDNDGIYIIWNFENNSYVNHLNSYGVWTQGWNAHGNELPYYGQYKFIKTSDGNITYFFIDNNQNILINKITINGTNYWDEAKTIEDSNNYHLSVIKNNLNQIYLLTASNNLKVRLLNEEGDIIWLNTFNITLPNEKDIITTQNGDLIINSDHKLYKISRNGELLWQSESIFPYEDIYTLLNADNNNGCIILILKCSTDDVRQLYFQHFNQNGEPMVSAQQTLITEKLYSILRFALFPKNDRFEAFWIEVSDHDINLKSQSYNISNNQIYDSPLTIENSSKICVFNYDIQFDFQNKPTFLWTNYFDGSSSPHIFIGKIENLAQNLLPENINFFKFSDDFNSHASIFNFAIDKYQDIIGVVAIGSINQQINNRIMLFKAFQGNGNFLYQYSISQPENINFDTIKIINASQNNQNSVFLIFFESINFNQNFTELRYIKLVNGIPEFETTLPNQGDIYLNENSQISLFNHYILFKYSYSGNSFKLYKINPDYTIDADWQNGGLNLCTPELKASQLSNGNLAVIYPENNTLQSLILTPDGDITQTELFQSNYLNDFLTCFENDYADIILKENNLLKRYRYSYSGDYISSSLIMENYDKEPIKLFKSEDNYQLFSLYNQPNSNISKIYLEEFNSNFELVSENIVVDTYDSWLQPTILKQNSNDFFIFWIDGRLNNQYDPEGCKRCKHLNYFYTYSNTFFGQYITSTLDSNDDAINSPENRIAYNFPNPFNPTTTIVYNPTKENLKNAVLEIYNIKGQKINEFNVSGKNSSLVWNGKDKKGNELPSGVYLYKLKAEGHSKTYTKKMILLK